jgi:hypothetical protein
MAYRGQTSYKDLDLYHLTSSAAVTAYKRAQRNPEVDVGCCVLPTRNRSNGLAMDLANNLLYQTQECYPTSLAQ